MNNPALRRVLVVDDSPDVHEDFRKVLCRPVRGAALDELEAELFSPSPGDDDDAPRWSKLRPHPDRGARMAAPPDIPVFEIDSAFQGHEAVTLVHRALEAGRPYAMAFVDIRMPPGYDGLETIRRLWTLDPAIEVVVCSAYSDHSWEQMLAVIGETDQLLILKKPFQADEARQLALALTTKRRLKRAAELRSEDLERRVAERTAELAERNQQLEQSVKRRRRTLRRLARSNIVRTAQARTLSSLLALSHELAACEDVDAAVSHALATTAALLHVDRALLLLPDRGPQSAPAVGGEAQSLRIAGALGVDPAVVASTVVPVGVGLAGRVYVAGTAVVLNSQAVVDAPPDDSPFDACGPLVCRALVSSERVVGVLHVTRSGGHDGPPRRKTDAPFSARDLATIDTICNMAASTIHDLQVRRARDEARDSIVTGLATLLECRDSVTGPHLERVSGYALLLAESLRALGRDGQVIDAAFLHNLRRAVPLHDIGKAGIPDRILMKPGRLTSDEFEIMRTHTRIGARAIEAMRQRAPETPFLALAAEIALHHHERWDGTGYPHGLAGEAIPLAARLTALADVYDALTTVRPYKPAYTHARAVAIILEEAGRHFDPAIVAAFERVAADFEALAAHLGGSASD